MAFEDPKIIIISTSYFENFKIIFMIEQKFRQRSIRPKSYDIFC